MSIIYALLYLICIAAIIKAIHFWLYLWQVKEYRLDRFLAEYGDTNKISRFWLFAGGRTFRRPQWTAKSVILTVAAILIFIGGVFFAPTYLFLPAALSPDLIALIYFILFYFLVPPVIFIAVLAAKIPTYFIKQVVFQRAKKKIARMKNLLVVGITGSYGKSSTKEFVAQILGRKFKVAKTPENVNTEIGIAQWVLRFLPEDAQIAVIEMGAYKRGEIKNICGIVKPAIGILTGINEQHMALFGSLENIKKAKFELIESLEARAPGIKLGGRLIKPMPFLNGEDQNILSLAASWEGIGTIYRRPSSGPQRQMPLHYLLNLQAAIEVAEYLGMTHIEIEEAIRLFKPSERMIKSRAVLSGMLVVGDTYSANPDGVLAALDYLALQNRRWKIIVMPCLIELGEAASRVHQKIGEKICSVCDLAIIQTPDFFSDIKRETGDKAVLAQTLDEVIPVFKKFMQGKVHRDVAVLLEGRLPEDIVRYFERTEILDWADLKESKSFS